VIELVLALGKLPSELTVPVVVALVIAVAVAIVTIRGKQGKVGLEQAVGVSEASIKAVAAFQEQIVFLSEELQKANIIMSSLREDLEEMHKKHHEELEKTLKLESEILVLQAENRVLRKYMDEAHSSKEAE